jgi:hypothetical protein
LTADVRDCHICYVGVFGGFCLCKVIVSVVLRSRYTLRKAAFNSVFPYLVQILHLLDLNDYIMNSVHP